MTESYRENDWQISQGLCLACFGSPDPYVDLPSSDRISVECCPSLGADVVLFGFVL